MMLRQPIEKRNLTSGAIEHEARNIRILNEALGNTKLTAAEERSLVWLCGWETSTLKNIISAFQKAYQQERQVVIVDSDNTNRLRQVLEGFLDKGTKIYYVHESCNESERTVFRTEKELKQMQDMVAATADGSTNNMYKIHNITPVSRENMESILEKENLETVLIKYAEDSKDRQIVIDRPKKEDRGLER